MPSILSSASLVDVGRRINSDLESRCQLKVGGRFRHPSGRTVEITSGQFLSNGRVSNFWYWREVVADGKLGPEENGYGWM